MKARIPAATALLLVLTAASAASAQSRRPASPADECTITAHANTIARIEMVRLKNGFYSHKAYDSQGRFICDGEWSATYELNKEAAEILRAKGNDRAVILDRVAPRRS